MMPKLGKYLQPGNYLGHIRRLLNRHVLARIEENRNSRNRPGLAHRPIFVLGAPRSGSTIVVQVITDALDIGYISNRHCSWFGAPALAERLFRPLGNRPDSDYRSSYGVAFGPHAPAECGEWWYRFFRRQPPYVTLDEVDPARMEAFRFSVAALTQAFDKPVLFKNLYASLRIQAIAEYLPESLFIVIRRNEVDNGHSLLEARLSRFGSYEQWFSVEPPDVEKLKMRPVHEQVIEQIRNIYETIECDLRRSNISPFQCHDLKYEEFCVDPAAEINQILDFLESHECRPDRRNAIHAEFDRRDAVRIDPAIYQSMEQYSRGAI